MNIEKHITRLTKVGLWFSDHFRARPFKIYFDHSDTPYREECQCKGKYDTEWKRLPYRYFLGHSVIKMKLFGIFTIYDLTKKKYKQWEEARYVEELKKKHLPTDNESEVN